MREFLFLAIFGLFCVVVQANPVVNSCLFPIKPDLTIPLVFYVVLFRRPLPGFFLTMWFGFLMDLFSGSVLGLFLFLRMSLFFIIHVFKKIFFLENKFLWTFFILLFFLLDSLLIHFLFGLMGRSWGGGALLKASFAQGCFSLFLSLLVFPFYYKLEKFLKRSWEK